MSLTEPPLPDGSDEIDRPPSRRFTILFIIAMVVIALGYTWVWQAKTSRVVVEQVAPLILGTVTTTVPGHGAADASAVRDSIAAHLLTIRGVSLAESIPPEATVAGRAPPPVFRLAGALDGSLHGPFELALRRTDARTDSLLYIYRVRGSTLSEVAHRMAVQVAMSLGLPIPADGRAPADAAAAPAAPRTGSRRE
ncbi:MAG: hypothetical protein ACREK1_00095 [Longimicrobiales bacterium]